MLDATAGMGSRARKDGLIVYDLDDEVVVYDLQRHRAHRLNRPAALVWRACNGRRTVADLAALLRREVDPRADADAVWSALDKLGRAHLLDERPPPGRVSRRRVVRALVVAPIVVSLLAPSIAQAASCFGRGHPCEVGNAKRCCSQICIAGKCL